MSVIDKIHGLKNKLIKKYDLYDLYYYFYGTKYDYLYENYKGKKKIFLLMEPEYGNLGDQAIAIATEEFIKDNFPEYLFIGVTEDDTCRHLKSIKGVCSSEDIIFLQGGGNMGSMYPYIERMRRFCIRHLRDNKIVSMPTTVTYRDNSIGKKEFKRSLKVYNSHPSLILFAREEFSYKFMMEHYKKARVLLVPDIVFYLQKKLDISDDKRRESMVCLRKEMESIFSDGERTVIINGLEKEFPGVFLYDTEVKRTVSPELRKTEIMSLMSQFLRARFVVTDRMHGMIFAAITGTPCVVMKSLDNKVIGSYRWLNNINYITMIEKPTVEKIIKEIDCLMSIEQKDTLSFQRDYFAEMKEEILD